MGGSGVELDSKKIVICGANSSTTSRLKKVIPKATSI
jgi:hypothetical protein